MKRPLALIVPLAAALLSLVACEATQNLRDVAKNPEIYRETGYKATHRQDRSVWIAPLADRREPLPSHKGGVYPMTYTQDVYWARPVVTMVDEVLRKEIADSGLFREVAATETAADWVLRPTLVAFNGSIEERVAGRIARGEAILYLRVLGPRAGGERAVLREQRYVGPVDARGMLFLPDPHALAGVALRRSIGSLLVDLDRGGRLQDGIKAPARVDTATQKPWSAASAKRNE